MLVKISPVYNSDPKIFTKLQHQNSAEDKMGVYIILLEGGNINEWSLGWNIGKL